MSRETIKYEVNGEITEAPLFKKGDKVQQRDSEDKGIVQSTENDGTIVTVNWLGKAKDKYGSRWLADSLVLIK